jgi:hypothetical protein
MNIFLEASRHEVGSNIFLKAFAMRHEVGM